MRYGLLLASLLEILVPQNPGVNLSVLDCIVSSKFLMLNGREKIRRTSMKEAREPLDTEDDIGSFGCRQS